MLSAAVVVVGVAIVQTISNSLDDAANKIDGNINGIGSSGSGGGGSGDDACSDYAGDLLEICSGCQSTCEDAGGVFTVVDDFPMCNGEEMHVAA